MRPAFKIALATAAYAGLHSLLASSAAKRAAARVVGGRERNAFYRPWYLVQSVATFAPLVWYIRRQPGRVLYDVRGPARWAMRAGQGAAFAWAAWAASEIGLERIFGVTSVREYAADTHVEPEPAAQGPAERDGRMYVRGPFRFSRHPLNLAPVPIFWLNPTMTTRLLAFSVAATAYMWLGSLHEEQRLVRAYGHPYREYQRSGVPFFMPRAHRVQEKVA